MEGGRGPAEELRHRDLGGSEHGGDPVQHLLEHAAPHSKDGAHPKQLFLHLDRLVPNKKGDVEQSVDLCVGLDERPTEVSRHLILALELVPHGVEERRGGSHVAYGTPGASSVGLRDLTSLRVVLEVSNEVLEHLAPGPLLHPRKLRGGVAGSLAVDDFGQDPITKHRTLKFHRH